METMRPPKDPGPGSSDATPGVAGSLGLVALLSIALIAASYPIITAAVLVGAASTLLVQRARGRLRRVRRQTDRSQRRQPAGCRPATGGSRRCA